MAFQSKPKSTAREVYLVRQIQLIDEREGSATKGSNYWAQPGDRVTLNRELAAALVNSNKGAYVDEDGVPDEALAEAARYVEEREIVQLDKDEAKAIRRQRLANAKKPKGAKTV